MALPHYPPTCLKGQVGVWPCRYTTQELRPTPFRCLITLFYQQIRPPSITNTIPKHRSSLPAGIVCCAASQTRLRRTRLGTAYDSGQAGFSSIDGDRKKPIMRVYPEKSLVSAWRDRLQNSVAKHSFTARPAVPYKTPENRGRPAPEACYCATPSQYRD